MLYGSASKENVEAEGHVCRLSARAGQHLTRKNLVYQMVLDYSFA